MGENDESTESTAKYGSVDDLRRSDEYNAVGVLGKQRLLEEHFPDLARKPSNAAGERRPVKPAELVGEPGVVGTGV